MNLNANFCNAVTCLCMCVYSRDANKTFTRDILCNAIELKYFCFSYVAKVYEVCEGLIGNQFIPGTLGMPVPNADVACKTRMAKTMTTWYCVVPVANIFDADIYPGMRKKHAESIYLEHIIYCIWYPHGVIVPFPMMLYHRVLHDAHCTGREFIYRAIFESD